MEGMRDTDATGVRYALLEFNGSSEDRGQERERDNEEGENRHHLGGASRMKALCACRAVGRGGVGEWRVWRSGGGQRRDKTREEL